MRAFVIILVLLASIAAGHAVVLFGAPSFIMGKAMAAMEERDVPTHAFALAERMTPETQRVVRPSPDLAYSLCLFDFSSSDRQPLIVHAEPWSDYSSVSFFDAQTNNFATLRDSGEGIDAVLLPPGASAQPNDLVSPSEKGIILIRRLAPSDAAYREVAGIAAGDRCEVTTDTGDGE